MIESPPLHEVQPDAWLVYADWAAEHPEEALYSEDKARRIAFILQHWWRHGQFTGVGLWLALIPVRRHHRLCHIPDGARTSDGRGYLTKVWQWRLALSAGFLTTDEPQYQFTNPGLSELCRQNKHYGAKFFQTLLYPEVTRRVLGCREWKEYLEKFNGHTFSLRDVILAGHRRVRRTCWTRGEYLHLEKIQVCDNHDITGEYRFVWAYATEENRKLLLPFNNQRHYDALSHVYESKTVRPKAQDWVSCD